MRFIVTGGGTGGHIYPAMTIAKKLIENNHEVIYVGRNGSLEERLVAKEDIEFKGIDIVKIPKKNPKDAFKFLRLLFKSLDECKKIIKDFKPDLVIGTGGYVSGPLVYAAQKKKIKSMIFELNVHAGITTRLLKKRATRILVTNENTKKLLKREDITDIVGIPIREEFDGIHDKASHEPYYDFDNGKKVVLSFGGSGGQKSINENVLAMIKKHYKDMDFNIFHVSGTYSYNWFKEELDKDGIDYTKNNVRVGEYLYDMPKALIDADMVITSAGALTLNEVSCVAKPVIIIPKAYVVENHQEYNARYFEDMGAAKMILEKDLNEDLLYDEVNNILHNEDIYMSMQKGLKNIFVKNAIDEIYDIIIKTI